MASNKDIKELMQARKAARRAIPQVDPAQVVNGPSEPEVAVPPQTVSEASATPAPPVDPSLVPVPAGAAEAVLVAAPDTAPAGDLDDPRTQPAPADNPLVAMTLKVRRHHQSQLKAESYYRDMRMQDILETALDEYFEKRYASGKGRPQV